MPGPRGQARLGNTTTGPGMAGIDGVYVARRVISPVYLRDAAAEVVLLAGWVGFMVVGGLG